MNEDLVSITIKGINKKAKDNFSLFCTMFGKSMNEVLKDFINGAYVPNPTQRQYMIMQTLNNLLLNNPSLIDEFILEQEPLFAHLSEIQKVNNRMIFCSLNPTYIYEKYIDWLETEEGIKYE